MRHKFENRFDAVTWHATSPRFMAIVVALVLAATAIGLQLVAAGAQDTDPADVSATAAEPSLAQSDADPGSSTSAAPTAPVSEDASTTAPIRIVPGTDDANADPSSSAPDASSPVPDRALPSDPQASVSTETAEHTSAVDPTTDPGNPAAESVGLTTTEAVVLETTQSAALSVTAEVTGGSLDQCNDLGSVGGDTIACDVTITNNCTYNAATPDQPTCETTIVTSISCVGTDIETICPTGGTTLTTTPITEIIQCNSTGLGGASTVTCTVTVTNNLYGYPIGSAIDSTVLQCEDPGTGPGGTLTCVATPPGNDRTGDGGPGGQSVTQCNDSGGAGGTLTCTVTAPPTQSTGLPTTVNQCNQSGTEGASTVTCTATITNNFLDSTEGGDDEGDTGGDTPGGEVIGGTPGGGTTGGTTGDTDGGDKDGGDKGGGDDNGGGDGGGGTSGSSGGGTGTDGGGGTGAVSDYARDVTKSGSSGTKLPFTGVDLRSPVLIGVMLLALGLALARTRRFRPGSRFSWRS